ncbi:MAG: choice-of-anchor J domain-containing protein [bacterium]
MNKTLSLFLSLSLFSGIAQADDTLARSGFTAEAVSQQPQGSSNEGFDDITLLTDWDMINVSNPVGTTNWFQGNDTVFSSHSGASTSYIAANFNSTSGSDISNWLILPDLGYLDSISFFTRTTTGSSFPDRIEVRLSSSGDTNVGSGLNDVGSYTTLLGSVNPNLDTGGYPEDWTQFNFDVNSEGRVAIRYFVSDGGPAGSNSNYIGIDDVSWVQGSAAPATPVPALAPIGLGLLALGVGIVGFRRRK